MKKILKTFILLIILSGIFLSIYTFTNIDFSRDETLFTSSREQNPTRFYYIDENSTPIEFYTIYNSGTKKEWVSIDDVNPYIKDAFLSVEDRNFYTHFGVDIKRTALAALNSVFHFRSRFGASTITQQLIKNISGDNENTVKRKIDEIIRAVNLENKHTKDEILELYLNIVPMGNGISGISLASKYYFGKDQKDLSVAESAQIAGITNAPARYNPFNNYEESIKRRDVVLNAMLENEVLKNTEYQDAISEIAVLNESRNEFEPIYPWFVETVCNDFCKDYSKKNNISETAVRKMILNGGLEFYTTMDLSAQSILEEYFENCEGYSSKENLKFAMTLYDAKTGYLAAIIGDKGVKTANRINSNAENLIIPGSSIKPLSLYAPLIESGKYNWASVFDDSPVSFIEKDGETYEYPKNYPRVYDGYISLENAVCYSKNTVASRIFGVLDKNAIFKMLREDMNLETLVESGKNSKGEILSDLALAPLALGQLTRGVSLRDLSEAYSVFVNDGEYLEGISYTSVYRTDGELLFENSQNRNRVFSADTARITALMLSGVTEYGTASKITLDERLDTAGKTGTSGSDLDRVFVGFTPYYLAGIWCGYDDGKTPVGYMDKSHVEIWDEVMSEIHENKLKNEENPETFNRNGLIRLPYCRDSGMLISDACHYDMRGDRMAYGYFSKDNIPQSICKKHIVCYYNQRDGKIYDDFENSRDFTKIALLDVAIRDLPIDIKIADEEYSYYKRKEKE